VSDKPPVLTGQHNGQTADNIGKMWFTCDELLDLRTGLEFRKELTMACLHVVVLIRRRVSVDVVITPTANVTAESFPVVDSLPPRSPCEIISFHYSLHDEQHPQL
jgi:hypothetical protein